MLGKAPVKRRNSATFESPAFVRAIEGGGVVPEGETVHLETSYTPINDNSLQIDWFKDGQPVNAGEFTRDQPIGVDLLSEQTNVQPIS